MLGASAATVLASACALSTGCALFADLNSDPYSLVDAGAGGGQCGADASTDASCPLVFSAGACAASCPSTQVCCASATSTGTVTGQCLDPSTCANQITSTALCSAGSSQCPGGDPCITQTCTFMGLPATVNACMLIPSCKAN